MAAIDYADEARLWREYEASTRRYYHYGVEYIDAGTVDRRIREAVKAALARETGSKSAGEDTGEGGD